MAWDIPIDGGGGVSPTLANYLGQASTQPGLMALTSSIWMGALAAQLGPPMQIATGGYGQLGTQLLDAATTATNVHTTTLSSWNSATKNVAAAAFAKHSAWVVSHAAKATQAGTAAQAAFAAQNAVVGAMPTPLQASTAYAAVKAAEAAMLAPGAGAAASTAFFTAESNYVAIQFTSAGAMTVYDNAATAIVAGLPGLQSAPDIVNSTGGTASPTFVLTSVPSPPGGGTGSVGHVGGAGAGGAGSLGTGGSGAGSSGAGGSGAGSSGTSGSGTGGSGTTGTGAGGTGSTPASGTTTEPTPSMPNMQNPTALNTSNSGLPGTSSNSTALAALAGTLGAGSLGLGLVSGGASEVAGASTGYRLPSNWSNSATKTASEVAAEEEEEGAVEAPRGAVAPATGRRGANDEEERTRSSTPISQLEVIDDDSQPGVIEYVDDET